MLLRSARNVAIAVLPFLAAATPSFGFEASETVWQRFTLDRGQTAGIALRGYRLPQFAPTLTPMVGLNYENAQTASAVRGAWLEGARVGSFAMGAVVAVDRHLSLTGRSDPGQGETERLTRFGGFLAFTDSGAEVGRIALTTGRTGGLDVRASRSFKLTDNVSLDVGPVISLGSFERFGYQATGALPLSSMTPVAGSAVNVDRAQLGAFGLATAIETRVSDRTVARMFAEYARVDAQRPANGSPALQNRDRVDFGFSLTTRIGQ